MFVTMQDRFVTQVSVVDYSVFILSFYNMNAMCKYKENRSTPLRDEC